MSEFKSSRASGKKNLFRPGNQMAKRATHELKEKRTSSDGSRQWTNRKRGEDLTHSILTEADVCMIRQIHADGIIAMERWRATYTAKALAEKFGVSKRCVERVLARETWSHV